jgi:hypothetical protein
MPAVIEKLCVDARRFPVNKVEVYVPSAERKLKNVENVLRRCLWAEVVVLNASDPGNIFVQFADERVSAVAKWFVLIPYRLRMLGL